MTQFLYNLKAKKFLEVQYKKKINISLYIFLGLFWLLLFFLFLFHNSYNFIPIDEVQSQTLLKTLVACFAGFGLSAAGASMQGITRNDLAGPTTLGLLPAATLGLIIYQLIGFNGTYLIFIFGIVISFLVILINFISLKIKSYESNNYKSILIGFILGAGISSINVIISSVNPNVQEQIVAWLGSTTLGYTWEKFIYSAPLITIGIAILMFMTKKINIIEEDLSLASSLGIKIKRVYWIVASAMILITVSSVVLIGSVVIIGIVMPHLIRFIFRTRNYKVVIPMSGIITSMVLMFSIWMNTRYTIGLNLFAVVISTPLFLYLIFKRKK